ncbi:M50 family peptidase [Hymenobacter aquaticus]|uniref:M50 family peptidase n=1 Tax=Hymenobacter aquaticus TaxID=1867101 RepID=A0A4Z0PXS9_9BACT|nr:M50 family metallopeptidase [Hymenobacter aquaticus]TGE21731.1 M50 family peptidase [Hymenobacter aquaticus]
MKEKRQKGWMIGAFLAFWIVLFWALKGEDWKNQLQAQAAILQLSGPVLIGIWGSSLLVALRLIVLVHEAGHAVGALLAKFQIQKFYASWLRIERKATAWKVRFKKPEHKVGGLVEALPTHTRRLRSRYFLFIAGGPAATLLSGAAALIIHRILKDDAAAWLTLGGYLFTNFLLVFGWLSMLVALTNLLPVKSASGYLNDGTQLKHLYQGGPAMHQQLAILHLSSLPNRSTRPRDWDPALLEQLLAHPSNTALDCYAHLYAYSYYHDCNDAEALRLHLNEAIDRRHTTSVSMQQYLFAEGAYVAALHSQDAQQARYWLELAQQAKPFGKDEALFARAAVAYVEGRMHEADNWLQAAQKQLQEQPSSGSTLQAFERMDQLQTQIRQASRAAATAI